MLIIFNILLNNILLTFTKLNIYVLVIPNISDGIKNDILNHFNDLYILFLINTKSKIKDINIKVIIIDTKSLYMKSNIFIELYINP